MFAFTTVACILTFSRVFFSMDSNRAYSLPANSTKLSLGGSPPHPPPPSMPGGAEHSEQQKIQELLRSVSAGGTPHSHSQHPPPPASRVHHHPDALRAQQQHQHQQHLMRGMRFGQPPGPPFGAGGGMGPAAAHMAAARGFGQSSLFGMCFCSLVFCMFRVLPMFERGCC